MLEVTSINPFSGGYVINYITSSACGCSFTRDSLMIYRDKEPTKQEAIKAIKDDIRNKR